MKAAQSAAQQPAPLMELRTPQQPNSQLWPSQLSGTATSPTNPTPNSPDQTGFLGVRSRVDGKALPPSLPSGWRHVLQAAQASAVVGGTGSKDSENDDTETENGDTKDDESEDGENGESDSDDEEYD